MSDEVTTLDGGFPDPVFDAQAVFRTVMDAMARPAVAISLKSHVAPPAPLPPAVAAVACTLADADTPVWMDSLLGAEPAVHEWLAFHTGARFAETLEEATFALAVDALLLPPLDRLAQGTQEYPDRSTTIVMCIEAFDGGAPLTFRGPGILGEATIMPRGLPADFVRQWNANTGRFPRGVDLVLAADDQIVCLPRTARLTVGQA